jgi:hypothetical protein
MPTKLIQMPSGIASNIATAIETLSNCVPAQNHENKDETFENMKQGLIDALTILKNVHKTIQEYNKSESESKSKSKSESECVTQADGDGISDSTSGAIAVGLNADKNVCAMSALLQICNFSQALETSEGNDRAEPPSKRPRVETIGNGDENGGSRNISNTPTSKRSGNKNAAAAAAAATKTKTKATPEKADADGGAGSKRKRGEKISTKKILSFEAQLGSLMDFKSKHNHCNVPNKYENKKLAQFVTQMRREYKAHEENRFEDCKDINSERIKILDGVGFQWKPLKGEFRELSFRERIGMLKKFKAENGHCHVSLNYSGDKMFGKWVAMQRRGYKKYQESGEDPLYGINADRIKQLEELGFKWVMQSGGEGCKSFEERLVDLRAYKEVHGNCNVPKKYEADQPLSNFIHKMRQGHTRFQKHGKDPRNRINADRIKILEEMGFCWNLKLKLKEDKANGLIPKKIYKRPSQSKKAKAMRLANKIAAESGANSGEDQTPGGEPSAGNGINENTLSQQAGAPNLLASVPPINMLTAGTQNLLFPPNNMFAAGAQSALLQAAGTQNAMPLPINMFLAGAQSQYIMLDQWRRNQEQMNSSTSQKKDENRKEG